MKKISDLKDAYVSRKNVKNYKASRVKTIGMMYGKTQSQGMPVSGRQRREGHRAKLKFLQSPGEYSGSVLYDMCMDNSWRRDSLDV